MIQFTNSLRKKWYEFTLVERYCQSLKKEYEMIEKIWREHKIFKWILLLDSLNKLTRVSIKYDGRIFFKHVIATRKSILLIIHDRHIVCRSWSVMTREINNNGMKTSPFECYLSIRSIPPMIFSSCLLTNRTNPIDLGYNNEEVQKKNSFKLKIIFIHFQSN